MAKIHIKKKALTSGRQSVYLDFSPPLRNPKTGKPQRYEFLDIFIYEKPSNVWERNHNSETNELLENIRANHFLIFKTGNTVSFPTGIAVPVLLSF